MKQLYSVILFWLLPATAMIHVSAMEGDEETAGKKADQLLSQLRKSPQGDQWEGLISLFFDDTTPKEVRERIRKEVSGDRELFFGAERWRFTRNLKDLGEERYLRNQAGILLISDGWPDPRDAFLLAGSLKKLAEKSGPERVQQLEDIKSLATPRVRHLFESESLKMGLW